MRRIGIALAAGGLLFAQVVGAQVSRPNPSPTPQVDPNVLAALPRPSAKPTCIDRSAGFVADPNGCVYMCSDGAFTLLAACSGAAFPTALSTATPAPTVTPTPNGNP